MKVKAYALGERTPRFSRQLRAAWPLLRGFHAKQDRFPVLPR